MPLPLETARFDALKKLAAGRLGTIEPAEEEVLRLPASTEDRDTPKLEDRPVVRAAFVRWLATDKDAAGHIDPLGLRVENATIASALGLDFCQLPFRLRFRHCAFQGRLYFSSAELPGLDLFDCETEDGIFADGLRVRGDVFLRKLEAKGKLRFVGARIDGDLDCSGAALTAEGTPLVADGANIAGGVFLAGKLFCSGKVRFLGAQIGGDMVCSGSWIRTLSCDHARLAGTLFWTSMRGPESRSLDLLEASVKTLHDDSLSWPAPGNLAVKGLEYRDLAHHESPSGEFLSGGGMAPQRPLKAKERVRWLDLQDDEDRPDPQAWMWMAKLFKEKGQDGDARRVLLSYRRRQADAGSRVFWLPRVALALLSWEPLLVLVPFLLILCWGGTLYQRARDWQEIVPTASNVFIQGAAEAQPAEMDQYTHAYPVFNPWIYTLENELPLVKFGMDDKWAPDPNLIAQGQPLVYWWLAGFRWFLIIAGWLQGIALTFGITRRFRD